ncbi:MAG: UDP-N-acetylmuramoyl-tripeptide--D-alanyl-D-alanine ligase [Leptotrichiaceae bacterium]|nr:UDP-N-acetylmuramoyl-tripeptide--D-alanyl-D-alanine ligase [Leptotrichiaceae bacterium]
MEKMDKNEIFWNIINNKNNNREKFPKINKISMNSKEIEDGDLFIAIRGGNKFVNEALEKGAYVVYDDKGSEIEENYKNKSFFVNDTILFLQEFAKKWRKALNVKVIGITGSNGKTTVKDMTYQFLSSKYKGKKTEGNYNNHIGLPFTLLRLEKDDEFIILEMGMSGFGEIAILGEIARPDISIITNIGDSHLEFLHSRENVFKAKTEILPYTKETLIINGDDEYLKKLEKNTLKIIKVLNTGNEEKKINKENPDFYYSNVNFNENGTDFYLKYFEEKKEIIHEKSFKTNVLGQHNILNITMAIAAAKECGVENKYIEETVNNIKLTDMRFQIMERGDTVYINDAYNASPSSMEKSLETFSEIYNDRVKIAVLGDMLELGERELELHSSLSEVIKRIKVDKIYLYGMRMKSLYNKLQENYGNEREVRYFSYKNEIKEKLKEITGRRAILIKGSRGMKLEEIIE